jgi:hypothetical protein
VPTIHTLILPSGKPLEFKELTVHEIETTLRNATREDGMNPVLANLKAQAAQRLLAIRRFGELRLDPKTKVGPQDLIAKMCSKELQLFKVAMDRVHDPTDEEEAAFFATLESTEVP